MFIIIPSHAATTTPASWAASPGTLVATWWGPGWLRYCDDGVDDTDTVPMPCPCSDTVAGQVFWRLQIPDNAEVVDSQGSGLELQLADKTTLEVR